MNTKYIITAIICTTILMACKKDKNGSDNGSGGSTPAITIKIDSPEDQFYYAAGDTVEFTGSITAKESIHDYSLTLMATLNGGDTTIFSTGGHEHGKLLNFHEEWVVNLPEHGHMHFMVKTLSHTGVENSKMVQFHAN